MAWFVPRWFLPLAVLGVLVALTVLALSATPAAAIETSVAGGTPDDHTPTGDTGADDTPVTLLDSLSAASKGQLMTDTGLSTRFTITGDCPPNGGGFRFQMVRAGTEWPAEGTDLSTSYWPDDVPSSGDHFEVMELRECGKPDRGETSEITVDVISPREKWEVRVYVWRSSDGKASDFSEVYFLFGRAVADAPADVSVTPGYEQLLVTWDEVTAMGTGMPVNTHIRWRSAQIWQPGEASYARKDGWEARGSDEQWRLA